MMEGFKTYFETLEGLSTEELDRSAEKLVRAEKRNLGSSSLTSLRCREERAISSADTKIFLSTARGACI